MYNLVTLIIKNITNKKINQLQRVIKKEYLPPSFPLLPFDFLFPWCFGLILLTSSFVVTFICRIWSNIRSWSLYKCNSILRCNSWTLFPQGTRQHIYNILTSPSSSRVLPHNKTESHITIASSWLHNMKYLVK
jgi:hypothetical protein